MDRVGVDGAVEGGSAAVGGLAGVLRKVQNGFVRSYALSLLGGVAARRPGPAGGEPRMNDFPWLTLLIALPLVGALVVTAFLPRRGTALPQAGRPRLRRAHPASAPS